MAETKRILAGEIATAHGIKGLVKLRSFVDDETLLESDAVFTEENGMKTISLKIKNSLKGDYLAEVKDVVDRNAAELLRGTQLYIDRVTLPVAYDGEYYIEDLKGMDVIDKDGVAIGTVLNAVNFGASDLLDIRPISGGQSFYMPFTEDTVLDVDHDKRIITVQLPDGLL